jgi:hypothetical protein
MASVLREMCARQRGVTGHDRPVRAAMCPRERLSREGSTCLPRRGVYALHLVFLFQLSPKWGMNLNNLIMVNPRLCRGTPKV